MQTAYFIDFSFGGTFDFCRPNRYSKAGGAGFGRFGQGF